MLTTPVAASPRIASPRSTCSILMTSAPQSAIRAEAAGTNVCSATSRMRTPCITAVIDSPLHQHASCGQAEYARRDDVLLDLRCAAHDALGAAVQVHLQPR